MFSTVDVESLKQQVFEKSKDEVKKSASFIIDIVHDDSYFETVERVLNRSPLLTKKTTEI